MYLVGEVLTYEDAIKTVEKATGGSRNCGSLGRWRAGGEAHVGHTWGTRGAYVGHVLPGLACQETRTQLKYLRGAPRLILCPVRQASCVGGAVWTQPLITHMPQVLTC